MEMVGKTRGGAFFCAGPKYRCDGRHRRTTPRRAIVVGFGVGIRSHGASPESPRRSYRSSPLPRRSREPGSDWR